MYDYKSIEKTLGRRAYFPNSDTLAYFDPESQTIHLNNIRKEDFYNSVKGRNIADLRQCLGTMMHEATHWADLIGTLWGRNYIRKLYECYRILPKINTPGCEREFYNFIDLHDQERRMMHSRYFRTVHPDPAPHDHRNPWGMMFSAGREFTTNGKPDDGRPILFAKFIDRQTGEQIARQPIVSGALLEVNAMFSEMMTNIEAIRSLQKEEMLVEGVMHSRELLGYLYNPDLTLYTAPAHLLARYANVTDVVDGYKLASALANIVLNMAPHHFDAIIFPKDMDAWKDLFPGFKAARDCGIAFKVIASLVEKWDGSMTVEGWLDIALERAGLPVSKKIFAEAELIMETHTVDKINDPIDVAEKYILSIGKQILKLRSSGNTAITFGRATDEKLPIVPMFDADGELITMSDGGFDTSKFSPEDMHARSATLATWKLNFLNACR